MWHRRNLSCFALIASVLVLSGSHSAAADRVLTFEEVPDRVILRVAGNDIATYTYRDREILRPFFANVRTQDGVQVTRTHPPSETRGEATDHATMHPGIWLAFGDLSGADFWRNKAMAEHIEFLEAPQSDGQKGAFTVRNRYRSQERTICEEVCRHTFSLRPNGWLLEYDSTFTPAESELVFGDQEELGLGVRMAAPLRAEGGSGRILSSEGKINGGQVRGTSAAWCDYSGILDGKRVGLLLMPHPQNFRASWYHARDYGLLVANPFGEQALTGGSLSRVLVPPGESLRLRFGVFIYSVDEGADLDREAVYRAYTSAS